MSFLTPLAFTLAILIPIVIAMYLPMFSLISQIG